jgi:transposase-like protein
MTKANPMKLPELLNGLSKEERVALYNHLRSEFNATPQIADVRTELNKEQVTYCPHCKSADIYGHGVYKGRKRYMCKNCKKTFNDFTGTAISGIKKTDKFQQYIELVIESVTIRKAASKLGVDIKTIFYWRHKLLSSLPNFSGDTFTGIVECDDKILDINDKGNKKLNRESYKRPSDRNTKRGISNDKVSVMVASDRKGNITMQVAKIGRIDTQSIENTIGDLITKENILCSDAHPSIICWAKGKEIEHHTFVASKQHIKSKCYHVQHVNSIDNRYERWVKSFYGVATKYLGNYLNWFVFLEKIKKSATPIKDLARIIASNINAGSNYQSVKIKYEELLNPHYLTT